MGPNKSRLQPLDGLRGIAALIVVCYHFATVFCPLLTPDRTDHPRWFIDTPLGILLNGPFSVSIFFVLSGFVVSQAAAKARDPVFISVPLRYARLALPAAASVIFAWCLTSIIAAAGKWSGVTLPHTLLNTAEQTKNLFPAALYDGFIGIFKNGKSQFNYPLWTMRVELVGSIVIYVLYGTMKDRARGIVTIFLAVVTLLKPFFLSFIIGSVLRDLWTAGRLRAFFPSAVLCVGILLGAPGPGFAERMGLPLLPHDLTLGAPDGFFPPIAAGLILYSVLFSPTVSRLLSAQFAQYLGHISFPLYLMHVPILSTVFLFVYVIIKPETNFAIFLLFCVYLACCLAAAFIGEVWVDGPLLVYLGKIKAKTRSFWKRGWTADEVVS